MMKITDKLKSITLVKDLSMPLSVAWKLEQFFTQYPLRHYEKCQLLMLADQVPTKIYYIVSGYVRVYDISQQGHEMVVNVYRNPSFFPMAWAINKTPIRYFHEAGTEVVTREAPPEKVLEFVKKNPDVMYDQLSEAYIGAEAMRRRMVHLMGGTAKNRLMFELVLQGRRFGKPQQDGSYSIDLSEGEIGARSGLSRETVSREIQKLKQTGLLSVTRQGILIKNVDELETRLGAFL
jgi:CRP-like cAMP-binding protein